MKLAIVLPGGVDRSGEYRVIPVFLALIGRLARRHDVHVFVLHQEPRPATWPLLGATIHNIGEGRTRSRAVAAIVREHRRGRFDVIQAIFSGACSLIAVTAALLLRVPGAVHIAGGELVALDDIGYGGRRFWKGRLREAVTLRAASVVTAASAPVVDALRALGVPGRRVALGVDLDRWPALAPRPRTQPCVRFVHVASLNRVKDQATLLRALATLAAEGRPFTLDVVGVDTLDGAVQALAAGLGLAGRVRFVGFRTQRELRPFLEAADLLLLSSRHEAGPLVLLEAAVAGVPTVGTAVGHLVEWAPTAALAVPVGDASAMAVAIARVIDDEPLRLRLAVEAQRRALAEDAGHTAATFEALYRELVAGRR
ncbi:MAG: glycosyltransferase family 4 protein [Luteibacter sp.]